MNDCSHPSRASTEEKKREDKLPMIFRVHHTCHAIIQVLIFGGMSPSPQNMFKFMYVISYFAFNIL